MMINCISILAVSVIVALARIFHSLLQTTQPQQTWDQGVINILSYLLGAVGGTAGLISIIFAWINRGKVSELETTASAQGTAIHNVASRSERITEKVNEVAAANPADVAPLEPAPVSTLVPPQVKPRAGETPCRTPDRTPPA